MSRSRRTDLIRCFSSAFLLDLMGIFYWEKIFWKMYWGYRGSLWRVVAFISTRTPHMEPPITVCSLTYSLTHPLTVARFVYVKNYAITLNFNPVLGSITILPRSLLTECSVARSITESPLTLHMRSCSVSFLLASLFGSLIFIPFIMSPYRGCFRNLYSTQS